jgi:hypothetical protein
MSKESRVSDASIGKNRTHISMSKQARVDQTNTTNVNWGEMAKMLFWADVDQERQRVVRGLISRQTRSRRKITGAISYSLEQIQYILTLMLILTTAEKRTQELYQKSFAQRCDKISKNHGLKDHQYWIDNEIPAEWRQLDDEFEQRALEILLETLKEYHLDDIARDVQMDGSQLLFDIIGNIEAQFLNILKRPTDIAQDKYSASIGSIPETLRSSPVRKNRTAPSKVPHKTL